jgi:nucleotide-binding universal stress UspA family protein
MVNILVPTDLSKLSKVALQYAIKVANKVGGSLTLLHVIVMEIPATASMRDRAKVLEKELLATAQEDMAGLVKETSKLLKTTQSMNVRVVVGTSFSETVKKEAKKLGSELIIMGTKGASGLKKYILGSNTTAVIDGSNVPVLAVPEFGEFKAFKNVVYASDLRHLERELKLLTLYLGKFESTVHIIHITSAQKNVAAAEAKIDALVQKAGYKNVVVRVIVNKKVDEAINNYVDATKANLLATFTHEHSFFDKLFDRSITRQAAFQSKLPLLTFKQR